MTPIVNFRPRALDVRGIPLGTAVVFDITVYGEDNQEDDTFEAVVYHGSSTQSATVVVTDNLVNCLWSVEQVEQIGLGIHRWRFTRVRNSLPRDLCAGKFEVLPRV